MTYTLLDLCGGNRLNRAEKLADLKQAIVSVGKPSYDPLIESGGLYSARARSKRVRFNGTVKGELANGILSK